MTSEQQTRLFNSLIAASEAGNAARHKWGDEVQTVVALEEAGELVAAVSRHLRGRGTSAAVTEEIADVLITCLQLAEMHGMDEVIANVAEKAFRLSLRVERNNRP